MKFVQISACATMPKVGYGLIKLFGLDHRRGRLLPFSL